MLEDVDILYMKEIYLDEIDETYKVDVEKNEIDVDVEKNEINECVICLEPVTEASEISKFGCVHSKYMHNDCVKNLRKCPLCREVSIVPAVPAGRLDHQVDKCHEKILYFCVGSLFSIMIFVLLQPMIMFSFYGGGYYRNYTMYNETMYNETNYYVLNIKY